MDSITFVDIIKFCIVFGSIGIGLGSLALFWMFFMPPLSILPFRQVDEKSVNDVLDSKYSERWFFIPTSQWKKTTFFKALAIKKSASTFSAVEPFFLDSSINEERGIYFIMNSAELASELKKSIEDEIDSSEEKRILNKVLHG